MRGIYSTVSLSHMPCQSSRHREFGQELQCMPGFCMPTNSSSDEILLSELTNIYDVGLLRQCPPSELLSNEMRIPSIIESMNKNQKLPSFMSM
mmetsp:Transcript_70181/g.228195  ORF Transcript_70181/g.228195 Transcript_70181/m.228195 type:complete len:93 (-) Transcript_70181:269-547(-)